MDAQKIVKVRFRLKRNDISVVEPDWTAPGHTDDINAYLATANAAGWFSAGAPWARLRDGTEIIMARTTGTAECPAPPEPQIP